MLDLAKDLLKEGGAKVRLPADVVIANGVDENAETKIMPVGPVPDGWRVLDIGPQTVADFGKVIQSAKTVVWNGSMGMYELPVFWIGTFGIAQAVAESHAIGIVGGGNSVEAIQESGLAYKITHISTGGGASLEMLEGATLPGVVALQEKA